MDIQSRAQALLRELYVHYDHGGHSARSLHSQALEAVLFSLPYSSHTSPITIRGESQALRSVPVESWLEHQYRLFPAIRYANDHESIRILIVLLKGFYTSKAEEDKSFLEEDLVMRLESLVGADIEVPAPKSAQDWVDCIHELRQRGEKKTARNW